jgi:TolB-like protein/DNA-binding winged helix-turn-helix (wHTH) protein/Tfp pilus assembly protein PilF
LRGRRYRFGDFFLDLESGFLRRDGQEVLLRPKTFELLKQLVLRAGRLVPKNELVEAVWGATAVTDNSLAQCMFELRRALDDDAQAMIRTVARRGYVFEAPVSVVIGDLPHAVSNIASIVVTEPAQAPGAPVESPPRDRHSGLKAAFRRLTSPWPLIAGLALVVLAGASLLPLWIHSVRPTASPSESPPVIRLAVVPFENLTGDARQDYFSDGLTEEMITQLGGLAPQRLRVIARTSVMRYKKSHAAADQIGRELGVDYILAGSARKDGTRVRVTAQLVQAHDHMQLWSQTYDREQADLLTLEDELAQRVVGGLAVQLLPRDARKAGRLNQEAYDLYLQGRAQFNSGPGGYTRALELFQAAIDKDPRDAASYAAMARVWQWQGIVEVVRGKEAAARQEAAAIKSIELNDTLSESHVALAGAYVTERDWQRADGEFKRAIQLNPNDANAHFSYGDMCAYTGRLRDAQTQLDWAIMLDPLNPSSQFSRGGLLLAANRPTDAIREWRTGLASFPGVYQFHWMLWRAFHIAGNDDEALSEAIAVNVSTGQTDLLRALKEGKAASGYKGAMRRAAELLEAQDRVSHVMGPVSLALMQHDAGNDERAIYWIERANEDGDPNLGALGVLAPDLKKNPTAKSLLQRFGVYY